MTVLLSRSAEELYWLGRHLERAESLARIVREHTNLLVDIPIEVESDWTSLLAITASTSRYESGSSSKGESDVMRFLIADTANPGSLVATLTAGRENLRISRQIVPSSAWETLNRLHIKVMAEAGAASASRSRRTELCATVIESLRHLSGILLGSMTRDHAYSFIELGRFVERADMTTRVIDVRAGALLAEAVSGSDLSPEDRSPYEDVRWLGVLRSVGGQQMYQRAAQVSVEGDAVVAFLVGDAGFPRSVSHCLAEVSRCLSSLPERAIPKQACEAADAIVAARPLPVTAAGLHTLMDTFQLGIGRIHEAVCGAYFGVGVVSAEVPAVRAG